MAVTRASSSSSATARAMAPLPVPTSRTFEAPSSIARSTRSSVSGLGIRTLRSTISSTRRNPLRPTM